MLRKTPLKRKRERPRRNEGRIQHGRVKPRARAAPNAAEKRHVAFIAGLPCLVCGARSTVHHVTSDGFKRIARSPRRVVPLCPVHHQIQHGPHESVEALGHAGFRQRYGIDLLLVADQLWRESQALG